MSFKFKEYVRGVFVIVPRGMPRAITTWAWILKKKGVVKPKIQPKAQSLAQGLVGHLPKIFKNQEPKS